MTITTVSLLRISTWLVAFGSTVAIIVGAVGQPLPIPTQPSTSHNLVLPRQAGVLSATQGPGKDQIILRMSSPFVNEQVQGIADRFGLDLVTSYPAFGTYVLNLPQITVDVKSNQAATVYFPKIATWQQIKSYIVDNGLTLIPSRYRPDDGGWFINVRLPQIQAQPIDKYAGLWRVTLPGHPSLERVTQWATSKGFAVVRFDSQTGTAVLRGHPVPRPRTIDTNQILSLLRNLIHAQTTPQLFAPTGLAVTPGTAHLTWRAAAGASAYAIWRSTAANGPWVLVGRVSAAVTPKAFTDTTAPTGLLYYRVTSLRRCTGTPTLDCDNQSPLVLDPRYSTPLAITTIPATGSGSTSSTDTSTTTNTDTTSGSGSTSGTGTTDTTTSGSGTTTTTTTTDSTTGQTGTDGTSSTSGTDGTTTTPPAEVVTAPAPEVAPVDGHVIVSWPAVAGATSYRVYRTAAGGEPVLVATTTSTHITDVGGTVGAVYSYGVLPVLPPPTTVTQTQSLTLTWAPATSTPIVLDMTPTTSTLSGSVVLSAAVRTGDGAGTVTWSVSGAQGATSIGTANARPSATDPLSWTASLSWNSAQVVDGTYSLHTVVADSSGNNTTFDTSVRIVNSSPSAPTALGAAPLQTGVALTWQQPASADAAVYVVNRDSSTIAELPVGTLSWVDWNATAGDHTYSIELQDQFGHLSVSAVAVGSATGQGPASVAPAVTIRLANGKVLGKDGAVSGRVLLLADPAAGSGVTFEYANDGATAWTLVPSSVVCTPSCATEWQLTGLAAGHYRVRAISAAGLAGLPAGMTVVGEASSAVSVSSKHKTITLNWVPGPTTMVPQGLRAISGVGAVTLLWSAVTDATGYQVERSRHADGPPAVLGSVGVPIFRDSSPTGGRVFYRVRAFTGSSLSDPSAAVSTILVPLATDAETGVFVAASSGPSINLGQSAQSAVAGNTG